MRSSYIPISNTVCKRQQWVSNSESVGSEVLGGDGCDKTNKQVGGKLAENGDSSTSPYLPYLSQQH